jgi:hypothetical protein
MIKVLATLIAKKSKKNSKLLQKASFSTFYMRHCKGPCDLRRIGPPLSGNDWIQMKSDIFFILNHDLIKFARYFILILVYSHKNCIKIWQDSLKIHKNRLINKTIIRINFQNSPKSVEKQSFSLHSLLVIFIFFEHFNSHKKRRGWKLLKLSMQFLNSIK